MTEKVRCEYYRIYATISTTTEATTKPTLPNGVYCYNVPTIASANGMEFDDPTVIVDDDGVEFAKYVPWPHMQREWQNGTFTVATFNGTKVLVVVGLSTGTTAVLHGYTRNLFKSGSTYSKTITDDNADTVDLTEDEADVLMYEALMQASVGIHQDGENDYLNMFQMALSDAYAKLPVSSDIESFNEFNDRPS